MMASNWRRSILSSNHSDPNDETNIKLWLADGAKLDDEFILRSELLLKMMREEQCWEEDVWPAHLQRLCKAYSAVENEERVQELALLAAGLTTAFIGHDQGWLKVAMAPQHTNWWGLHKGLTTDEYMNRSVS